MNNNKKSCRVDHYTVNGEPWVRIKFCDKYGTEVVMAEKDYYATYYREAPAAVA
jgi:hypothetical protein